MSYDALMGKIKAHWPGIGDAACDELAEYILNMDDPLDDDVVWASADFPADHRLYILCRRFFR